MRRDEIVVGERLDYLGDPLPADYEQWYCDDCTAMCNFEAMEWCRGFPCPFTNEKPESNGGAFAFIKRRLPDAQR